MLQSIITAAEKYSSYATAEYNRQGMLREVQEASDEDSDSLAWFTNTIAYKRWQSGNTPGICYPITPDSASSGHDNIAIALFYHLRTRFASKAEPFCHIFYFKPSWTDSGSEIYPALNYQEIFRSLISQALMTYDCLKDKLLFIEMREENTFRKLKLLLTTDQTLSIDDLINVLNLVINNIHNSTTSIDTRPSVILVIDRIRQADNKFQYFILRMLSGIIGLLEGRKAKLVVSTSDRSLDSITSSLGDKIDEDTECNGKYPRFICLANAKSVCGLKIAWGI